MADGVPSSGLLGMRRCETCGASLEGRRPQARFCSTRCRVTAWNRRGVRQELREAQEASVADVERQLADGKEKILVEGRLIHREAAWAAAAGIRATWEIPDARATGRVIYESGQWWVYVQIPLGVFPG